MDRGLATDVWVREYINKAYALKRGRRGVDWEPQGMSASLRTPRAHPPS